MMPMIDVILNEAAVIAETMAAIPLSHQHPQWSERRWQYHAKAGPAIVHGKGKNAKRVPSHRLIPIDRSRYPGHVLRAIRASATNFKGEVRR